jgi:thiol-disulfide isomerase/thioredoxin
MIRALKVSCVIGKLLALLACMLYPQSLFAWDSLDISAELRRPGVRLVVVEFYADWCAPCKKAVPKWDSLHAKYKERGLRLIVVSVGDGGTCSNPGWQPDKIVCDFDGRLQEMFGADTLPQAFLYSWQGSLLVGNGHFPGVKKAVEAYYRNSPRIFISEPKGQDGSKLDNASVLREIVRTDVRRLAKFEMVASDKELVSLRTLRKKGYQLNYDEAGRCKLGQDISANSELKIRLFRFGGERTLLLQVFSVESGCMLASSKARVGSAGLEAASFEAVGALVEQLVGDTSQHVRKETDSTLSSERPAEKLSYEDLMKKAGEVEAAWKKTQKIASEDALSMSDRVAYVRQFLLDHGEGHKYADEAEDLMERLRANHREVDGATEMPSSIGGQRRVSRVKWQYGESAGIEFSKTEVTVAQYRSCVEAGACKVSRSREEHKLCNWGDASHDDFPMNCVNFDEASAFCIWSGGRLPTEDEWEAEATYGGRLKNPWGDSDSDCEVAVIGESHESLGGCGKNSTGQVCSKPKGNSRAGLCDLVGNVWEWTIGKDIDADEGVLRGDSFVWSFSRSEAESRLIAKKVQRNYDFGFRCVQKP